MKKSFTLLELLISAMLLVFIFSAISNVINSLKISNKVFNQKKNYLIRVLYYDILNATYINIKHITPDIDEVELITSNTLYNYANPKVIWYVKGGNLIRLEKIKEKEMYYTLDSFQRNVKIFKIYRKNGKFLVFVNNKFFEFIKDFNESKNIKHKL
jgi:hypothetical protein